MIMIALVIGQTANFNIQVSVEFIALELKNLEGDAFNTFYTDTLLPGDTVSSDSADGIWIDNQSNVPVNIVSWGYDDTVFCAPEPIWDIESSAGDDTCCVGLAVYISPNSPNIYSAQWLDEIPQTLASGVAEGDDRYGYIYFIAPTDDVNYGERQHRIITIIGLVPE